MHRRHFLQALLGASATALAGRSLGQQREYAAASYHAALAASMMISRRCAFLLPLLFWFTCLAAFQQQSLAEEQPLVEGRFGQALNAAAGGFVAPADEQLHQLPLTVELWAKVVDNEADAVLIANGLRASGAYWELTVEDGLLTAHLSGFAPRHIATPCRLDDDQWHYVAMVLERNRVRLYVDAAAVQQADLNSLDIPIHSAGLGIGTRLEEKKPSEVHLDDVRISAGAREILLVPEQALIADRHTIALWSFDESQEDYLARWTPGGETNQRDLPYPHRIAEYEFHQDPQWVDGRWQETDKGPFLTHSTLVPGYEVGVKNLVIFMGEPATAAVMFDQQRCAVIAGLQAANLTIDPARFGLLRKPTLQGQMQFYLPPAKAWRQRDASGRAAAALENQELDYRGLYLQNRHVLLNYRVRGTPVWDLSSVERNAATSAISRQLEIEAPLDNLLLTVAQMPDGVELIQVEGMPIAFCRAGQQVQAVALTSSSGGASLAVQGSDVCLSFGGGEPWRGRWLSWSGTAEQWQSFLQIARSVADPQPLQSYKQPGQPRWGHPLKTGGQVAPAVAEAPYVIDTITVPYENPYKALFFISGLDFFDNGDAAVCTAHGDVWLVRGLDADLDRVSWQRFATGLYQPLGLEIVQGQVIVLGRDQLTRLHDLNEDGEADYYESFNHDLVITGGDHAFAMRLDRDSDGNFYFLKSGARPHGSALLKVTADGSQIEVVARGFRHPYGMGIGPGDEITVADNEGNFVPTSKIDLIEPGGFYGFLHGKSESAGGLLPARPLCFIPKVADNSSGGQIWVTSNRWGQYHRGEMLHLSWGRCTLHAVLRQKVAGVWQAATVQFPNLTFLAGPGEGTFHPIDGQLYVVGLNGWQTGAVEDGCFQRVRYTGAPIHMPAKFHVHQDGIEIRFTQPLDIAQASRSENYHVQQWNYRWSSTYGSFHYSLEQPDKVGHDTLLVTAAKVLPDGKTVFLEIPGLRPCDQLHVRTDIRTRDGGPLKFDLYGTINALDAPQSTAPGAEEITR